MTSSAAAQPLAARRQIAPNGVLGTSVFVLAESMFFAGLISAHTIVKMGHVGGWPPAGQPRLPASETLVNTAALILSGALLVVAMRVYKNSKNRALPFVSGAMLLGAFFVAFQGKEWVALLAQGLTLTSSTHGSFFYLIVGAHGLHTIAGLAALAYLWRRMRKGTETASLLGGTQIYWYFVVLLWPVLYLKVYL